jgi:hypothetical protein
MMRSGPMNVGSALRTATGHSSATSGRREERASYILEPEMQIVA